MHALALTFFAFIFALSMGVIISMVRRDFPVMWNALLGRPQVRIDSERFEPVAHIRLASRREAEARLMASSPQQEPWLLAA